MSFTDKHLLDHLGRLSFIAEEELAGVLSEPKEDVRSALTRLRKSGVAGCVSHSAAHLPTSWRYYLTARGIEEATPLLGFKNKSRFVRKYPASREWLAIMIGRMDAVASVYRLSATMSPGAGGLRTRVEFHRKGCFDATITLHDGRSFGVVRQGIALPRASLNERLERIAEDDCAPRPDRVLILTPSPWDRDITLKYWMDRNLHGAYVAAESVQALARRDLPVWRRISNLTGGECTLGQVSSEGRPRPMPPLVSPARKRASVPDPDLMVREAPAFGMTPTQKWAFDIITNSPNIPREHLARWLAVSEGRVSQVMRGLVDTWGLVESHGGRGNTRYTLSAGGVRYIAYRDRSTLETARGLWSASLRTDPDGQGLHEGSLNNRWSNLPEHTRGLSWILSKLGGEARADRSIGQMLFTPEWRCRRGYHHGERTFTPDAVVELIMNDRRVSFFLEYERRARYGAGVRRRLTPYELYYESPFTEGDLPPSPYTLFVVDGEEVAQTYVNTAAGMRLRLPILVSSVSALAETGFLGPSWDRLWEPDSPRMKLAELAGYAWNYSHGRMERRS